MPDALQVPSAGDLAAGALDRRLTALAQARAAFTRQLSPRNIKDLLEHLQVRYRQLRQGSIDEELFDVTAGYEALARA